MTKKKHDDVPIEGLWVSPEGRAYPVVEHLIEISHFPDRFGLTRREVQGMSIQDLRDVAVQLIRKGWLRFRYLSGVWNFEVDAIRNRIGLIEEILVSQQAYPQEAVSISQASPKREYQGTVSQFYERTMFRRYDLGSNPWRVT